MPIFHLHVSTGGRRSKDASGVSAPKSADAKILYICKFGKYARKGDHVVHVESGHMPAWARQVSKSWEEMAARRYWQAADRYERRNGRLFKQIEVALPDEMVPEQRLELIRTFATEVATAPEGFLPYTFAIHAKFQPDGHLSHFHAHIVFSERVNDGVERTPDRWFKRAAARKPDAPPASVEGGARKTMHLRRKTWLWSVRERWAQLTNDALARAGQASRIDHRTLRAQGVARTPEIKVGARAMAAARRGVSVLRFDLAMAQRAARAEAAKVKEAEEELQLLEEQVRNEAKQKERERAQGFFVERGRDLDLAIQRFRKTSVRFSIMSATPSAAANEQRVSMPRDAQRDIAGHSWAMSRRDDRTMIYESDAGRVVDKVGEITADAGNDAEISAMLILAREKGWTSLQFFGHEDFERRAMAAASEAGFNVAAGIVEGQARSPAPRLG